MSEPTRDVFADFKRDLEDVGIRISDDYSKLQITGYTIDQEKQLIEITTLGWSRNKEELNLGITLAVEVLPFVFHIDGSRVYPKTDDWPNSRFDYPKIPGRFPYDLKYE